MDVASDLATCKRLLDELEASERIVSDDFIIKLENIYYHLPPQTAPRLQRDFDQCLIRSDVLLGALFEKVDISDKRLLNVSLRLLLAYGNFRLAQITYHLESAQDEIEPDVRYTPILTKSKWYELSPLLPQLTSETIDWKSILVHGLVRDPDAHGLRTTCNELLIQNLHFYALIAQQDRFGNQLDLIKRNGGRIAEKLAEGIFDSANNDEEVITLNSFIFDLILPFTTVEQQSALIEAAIVARFKSDLPEELEAKQENSNRQLDQLISCLINNANLQEIFFSKLIEQLKYNIIRRKRRHSVEAVENGETMITLEGLLEEIIEGKDSIELLLKTTQVEVSSKSLQRNYLQQWIEFTKKIITKKTLTPKSSAIVLTACSVVLITCSKLLENDLNTELALLLAKTISATTQRKLDKLFKVYNPNLLIELTKLFAAQTELLSRFETPLMRFYRSYFSRHIRHCTIRHFQKDAEKFSSFSKFICERSIGKNKSTIIGYIYLCELSEFLESVKTKASNKSTDLYVEYGRSISGKLYSFLKKRPFTTKLDKEEDDDEVMEVSLTNGVDDDHTTGIPLSKQVQAIVIDALVCILKIAVERKDQTILDTYGELMLKLYNSMSLRMEELIEESRLGDPGEQKPIDAHLHQLINLYAVHKETIGPYICYDLDKNICEKLVPGKQIELEFEDEAEDAHSKRKSTYAEIKMKLSQLQQRDEIVYQTIINKQYSTVVDQNLGQVSDLVREESCSKRYRGQMVILTDVLTTLLNTCDFKTYENVLQNVVRQFECCDALNHWRVLNLLHTLEALIPKVDKDQAKSNAFKMAFPKIGCCLIRMAKSVELGPSVLTFTNPGTHKSSGGIQCCTYSNCIRAYTLVFNRFPPTFTNMLITDAMQVSVSSNLIRYAKYSAKLHRFFIQLASSIANLLKAVSMGKREVVEQGMPVFLSVLTLLIRCIILASDRKKLEDLPTGNINGHVCEPEGGKKRPRSNGKGPYEEQCKVYESQLEYLARDVGRLLNNLCFLETKLVDYAPQLISTYIKDTQRASCPDFVKKHLDEGVFRIFNLVDSYQKDRLEKVTDAGVQRKTMAGRASGSIFEMIHARLDQASREIFKDMHDHYNKFHRYLGKC